MRRDSNAFLWNVVRMLETDLAGTDTADGELMVLVGYYAGWDVGSCVS